MSKNATPKRKVNGLMEVIVAVNYSPIKVKRKPIREDKDGKYQLMIVQ